MDSIRHVLVRDHLGQPSARHRLVASRDWDDIRQWSDRVYMPYRVTPLGKSRTPDSVLDACRIGHFTLSRFKYGIPVNIRDFSSETGTGMVLTTLQGSARHWSEAHTFSDTGVGDAFVVDNSRTHYWVDFDEHHLQVNLTFEHDALAALHERWFGQPADERLWQLKFRLGGAGSSWLGLLNYLCQCVTEHPDAVATGPLGKHLEEMLGVHLLTQWRAQREQPSHASAYRLAPRHVLAAERHLREHARHAPTLTELATAAGVSVRTLNQAFRTYRGTSPMAALKEQRLQGVRAELLLAEGTATVQSIAGDWGFVNLGLFARSYRERFGELPSQTLQQRRLH
ncbi:AraC family transcriptional regulator [Macromonas nakdongensis]|uniref:AraC family transcriptional regulator n=1 Tax=Macromonas nakdongensis TaxID=1843082 RepID=UPI0018E2D22E|nr:helix-turn-helix transcriptional regulator [Macromonas nakdongensis]